MKILIVFAFICGAAWGQFPKMPNTGALKDLSKQVLDACKEDRKKVKGCESYTEVKKLKECLMKNEKQLSEGCKTSLKLVK